MLSSKVQLARLAPPTALLSTSLFITACAGGGSGDGVDLPDGTNIGGDLEIIEVSNGFGRLLPHQIRVADPNGLPTSQVIEIIEMDDLLENLTPDNSILPVTEWPTGGVLPNNAPGNHFIFARFTQDLDVDSILNPAVASGIDNNLTGAISVLQVDPVLGVTIPVPGVGFVGGQTYGPTVDPDNPTLFLLEEWVAAIPGENENAAQPINGAFPLSLIHI